MEPAPNRLKNEVFGTISETSEAGAAEVRPWDWTT
jgi:hypothetical protein